MGVDVGLYATSKASIIKSEMPERPIMPCFPSAVPTDPSFVGTSQKVDDGQES